MPQYVQGNQEASPYDTIKPSKIQLNSIFNA